MPVAKEQIRQIIADNNISSVADGIHFPEMDSKTSCRNLWRRN